jgi:ribosomal protein RSM22 (predicted rRNA methylase)
VCPLLATRDTCHFSQRLQTPRFARKTKHKKDGESDSNYSYVIIRRGYRPEAKTQGSGLFGAVAREEQERNAQKEESMQQGMIVPIKGAQDGSYEVMRYIPSTVSSQSTEPPTEEEQEALEEDMRKEAYRWPRLVYPPLKRSGHVVMDTCHPSGMFQ